DRGGDAADAHDVAERTRSGERSVSADHRERGDSLTRQRLARATLTVRRREHLRARRAEDRPAAPGRFVERAHVERAHAIFEEADVSFSHSDDIEAELRSDAR